ncbi:glycoside hydrolase family 3 N-terminal domain-containing protein [Pseudochryseolinea flava]|uniref:beta-glucosidase n=1 Tax=Pseudochryseolinea flava TaxID=2059302 RepID=A0A364XXQ0_9BACT|nr:glycoside hydrolase family 3 N-terminal domain-containing protein [Pseudochryseolinea flava]RAV98335.1 beta-glucosidase [Pseudochryseolinea flava]
MKRFYVTVALVAAAIVFPSSIPVPHSDTTKVKVDDLLSKMTLEEKVGQMAQVTLDVITKGPNEYVSDEPVTLDPNLVRKALLEYKVGSILNTANNRARTPEKWHELISQLQEVAMKESRLKIPVIYGVDANHGTTYTAGATMFPQEIGLAATFNRAIVKRGSEICAYETRASSIPWNFSPVLDLGRDPRFPRMWETFGEDVYLASEMGKQVIDGYEGDDNNVKNTKKVAATVKHFFGYSVPNSGKDRTPVYISEMELRERHLPSFKAAIDAGAHSLMVNSGIINGVPVHANKYLLTTLLKEEIGFKGVVVTDWADIENLHNRDKVASSHKEAVKLAINAGVDMSMIPYNFRFCDYLVELVKEGAVPMSRIDDAVRRILTLKYELGLFDKPVTNYKDYTEFGSAAYEKVSYDAAAESITLLKNKNNILPVKKDVKVLVAGPNANSMRSLNGGWSYSWQGEKVEEFATKYNTILEALQKELGKDKVVFAQGVAYNEQGKYYEEKDVDIDAAVKAAAGVDYIVLALGENTYTEKPGDLHDLTLSLNQINLAKALAKTGKPTILVLNEGRPRLIRDIEQDMAAVVQLYLPGNFGGDALADILFGDVNPSGKLPYTYPMYANTLVTYDHKPSEEQVKMAGMYDYASDFAVQYPFGFGLSYTTFEYSNLRVSKTSINASEELTITVNVKNTGTVEGKEAVQLYISDKYASVTPDMKRLRGFEKINLKAGESRDVVFKITGRDIAFVATDLRWTVEAGEFEINIDKQKANFNVTETKAFNEVKTRL